MTATKITTRIAAGVAGLAAVAGLTAAPANAQVGQAGLVNVGVATGDIDVTVLNDLIDIGVLNVSDLVDVENVMVVAQVPIGIAANVCPGVNAAVLGQANQGGGIACVADAESAADSRAFQRLLKRQGTIIG